MAAGDPSGWSLTWSPVYVLAYAVVSRLPLGGHPMDRMHVLCVLASTLALWWALRSRTPGWVAMLAAAWWAMLDLPLRSAARLYGFDMALWSLAGGLLLRGRDRLALVVMALGVLDRGENLLWLLGIGVWRAMWPEPGTRGLARWGALALAALLAIPIATAPQRGDRLWLAFSQHYALGVSARLGNPVVLDGVRYDPWLHHELLRRRAFPTATSIAGAALENPAAMVRHVAGNLARLPRSAVQAFAKPLREQRGLRTALLVAAALTLAAGLLHRLRHGPGTLGALGPRGRPLVACALLPLPLPLLLFPRSELLAPYALPLLLVAVRAMGGFTAADGRRRRGTAFGVLAACALLSGVPHPSEPPPHRAAVALLAAHPPPAGAALLAPDALRMTQIAGRLDLHPIELVRFSTPGAGPEGALAELGGGPTAALLDDRDPASPRLVTMLAAAGFGGVAQRAPFRLLARSRTAESHEHRERGADREHRQHDRSVKPTKRR